MTVPALKMKSYKNTQSDSNIEVPKNEEYQLK